ncbi:peptidase [Methylomonas sp. SURF-2]|uniref:Peptidase n=1 Tax=Methylomonas subterranea TaxID=2952225 RepID=A0ABT1TBM9_9GAMM|nr:peptidase [Methylomonas sp. SURF-2]MCQ8102867.1 peptidase [Methylomonas sp. SURF-2]
MTYCIAVSVKEGLVLTSDSRTNAGIDNVSVHCKMHVIATRDDRKIVLLSAGNLATSQAVLDQLRRDIKDGAETNLNTVHYLSEVAEYLGQVSLDKQHRHANSGQNGFFPAATFLVAGQIGTEPHGAYLVYPEGNYITTSEQTPYLQIGENKYGKPVLDRILKIDTPLEEAALCCLISMDSTMRSNVSVGPPVDMLIYHKDSLLLDEYYRFQEADDYLIQLRRIWQEKLSEGFAALPQLNKQTATAFPVVGP